MLDEYIFGRATRISQEAPVLVVRQTSTRSVAGGAANVAANLVALGARPRVIGVAGTDAAGDTLRDCLEAAGIDTANLLRDPTRPTTRKTRVLANHSHQVLRIDHEVESGICSELEASLLAAAAKELDEVDVVVLSDYQKGAVTATVISEIIRLANAKGVPVVANAKPKSLPAYKGATLVSLNEPESAAALGRASVGREEGIEAARMLREILGVKHMLVTLGANGMASESAAIPAVLVEVYDEAGAGDTVIATIALSIALDTFGRDALGLAAQTAACVVQKVGVAVPTAQDLARIAAIKS